MAEEKQPGFKDRNDVLKTFKVTGKFGWMHLLIAQRKADGKKFLRLKRYMNWFSIPDQKMLAAVQKSLHQGAEELGWSSDKTKDIVVHEISEPEIQKEKTLQSGEIDEELLDLLEAHPDAAKRLLSLNLKEMDVSYAVQILDIAQSATVNTSDRIKVAYKEVIEKISRQDPRGMQDLSDLMKNWDLIQITSLTNTVKNRLETISMFEDMIHNEKTYEIKSDNSIHRILEKNMWLIDDTYWISQSNKSLRTFIGEEIEKEDKCFKNKRPDFTCVNHDNKLIIVEIKRPALTLKKVELDQAELYLRIIKKYKGKSYNNVNVYLVGNKISDEAREIEGLRKGVELLTYQDFLEKCKYRYQAYLKIIEKI